MSSWALYVCMRLSTVSYSDWPTQWLNFCLRREARRSGVAHLSQLATLRQKGIDEDWEVVGIRKCGCLNRGLGHCGAVFKSPCILWQWHKIPYMEDVSLGKYVKRVVSVLWCGLDPETSTAITNGTGQLSAEHCLCSLKHHFRKIWPVFPELFSLREMISNLFLCIWNECPFGRCHALV